MAKKQSGLDDLFKKTEPGEIDTEALDEGNIQSVGVGLREGEIKALDAIGELLGEHMDADKVARNALMRIAIRSFLESYLAGDLTLDDLAGKFTTPEKPQPRLKL